MDQETLASFSSLDYSMIVGPVVHRAFDSGCLFVSVFPIHLFALLLQLPPIRCSDPGSHRGHSPSPLHGAYALIFFLREGLSINFFFSRQLCASNCAYTRYSYELVLAAVFFSATKSSSARGDSNLRHRPWLQG